MKGTEGVQSVNKATVGVGALLILLVLNLAFGNPLFNLFFGGGVSAGTRPTPPRPLTPGKDKIEMASLQGASKSTVRPAARVKDEFARYDPSLNQGELKSLLSRPVPKLGRNPFEFETKPKDLTKGPDTPAPPPTPPAPPPIPLKAVGYGEKPGGTKEAYICESRPDGTCRDDQEVYVAHEGEEFGKRYKATKITPQQIEVEDQTSHQTVQLLIPQ